MCETCNLIIVYCVCVCSLIIMIAGSAVKKEPMNRKWTAGTSSHQPLTMFHTDRKLYFPLLCILNRKRKFSVAS